MDKAAIERLVDEEIARRRLAGPAPPPRSDRVLRHPLTLTVVGFLLTGILGGLLSAEMRQFGAERDAARRMAEQDFARRMRAVDDAERFLIEVEALDHAQAAMREALDDRGAQAASLAPSTTDLARARSAWLDRYDRFMARYRAAQMSIHGYFLSPEPTIFNRTVARIRAYVHANFRCLDALYRGVAPPERSADAPRGYCSEAVYESVRAFPGCVTAFAEELLRALYAGGRPGEPGWRAVSAVAVDRLAPACAEVTAP